MIFESERQDIEAIRKEAGCADTEIGDADERPAGNGWRALASRYESLLNTHVLLLRLTTDVVRKANACVGLAVQSAARDDAISELREYLRTVAVSKLPCEHSFDCAERAELHVVRNGIGMYVCRNHILPSDTDQRLVSKAES